MKTKSILMVDPDGYDIRYSINPHMLDSSGQLKTIDKQKAKKQWEHIKWAYEALGMKVFVLPPCPDFPDMVFCANQTFPFITQDGQLAVILARMASTQRQGEVPVLKKWYAENGFQIYELSGSGRFEGNGDLIWNNEGSKIYAGFGFRTDKAILPEVSSIVGRPLVPLELIDSRFYHLDTCLSILGRDTAVWVPEAFSKEAINTLQKEFKTLLRPAWDEALNLLAANCFCPDEKNVLVQEGCHVLNDQLRASGFNVIEVNTSEFLKAGGSVFCLKQVIPK